MQVKSEYPSDTFSRLRAPFDVELIKWRIGARMKSNRNRAQALPYIDARLVQDRLDEVVGPENWRNEFSTAPMGGGVMCTLSIRVGGEWIGKADVAQQDEVADDAHDPEKDREIAVKAAASNALKRAAVQWGIGRYLYSFEAPWVNLEHEKFIARDEMPKLRKLLRHAFGDGAPVQAERHDPEPERAQDGASEPSRAEQGPANDSSAADASQGNSVEQGSPAPAASDAKKHRPSFGTAEQWASITARQRLIVKSISDRVRHNAPLGDIETFLTNGEGAKYPDWLRNGLLDGVKKKIKEQADARRPEVA